MRRDEIGDPAERQIGADFAPVRIGPGHRSIERTLAAVVVIIGLLGLAIAKPWAVPEPGADRAAVSPKGASAPVMAETPTPPYPPDAGGSAAAPRSLENVADWWSVLGTDYGFVSGRLLGTERPAPGVIVSTLTVWRQRPATVPLVPERLTSDCSPAAVVPVDTTVIGVTVPQGEAPREITVRRQYAGGRFIEIPVRAMPLGDRGIWLLVPRGDAPWQPGLYAVRLIGPAGTRWLSVCVAARAAGIGGPILDPAAWSLEAYRIAVGQLTGGASVGTEGRVARDGRLVPVGRRLK